MKRRTRIWALILALLLAVCMAGTASAAVLSKAQISRVEGILDIYQYSMWEYCIYLSEKNGKDPTPQRALIAFDAAKPVDAQMITAAVELLYYPGAVVDKTPSWMKPVKQTSDGSQQFSKETVAKMCREIFGVTPKKHAYTVWGYNYKTGRYTIGGDMGETFAPKVTSATKLKNGDIQVKAKHRIPADDGTAIDSGVTITAVLRPSKTTSWGFTFRSIQYKGTLE